MTDLVRCRDCVHWSRHKATEGWLSTRLGDCGCDAFIGTYTIPKDVKPGSVIVEIDEGWGFYTDEDFGCIHGRDAAAPGGERG